MPPPAIVIALASRSQSTSGETGASAGKWVRQTWSQDRVFFLDEDGCQYSLPVGWTDVAEPDVFVTAAAGRCWFRIGDLTALAGLIDGLRGTDSSEEV